MLLYDTDTLFEPFHSFLQLTVGQLNECAGFSELIVQILSIIGMTPVEVHLEPFSHKLKFMPESFCQNTCVAFRIGDICPKRFRHNISVPLDPGNVCPKGFGRSADNLLNLGQ